MSYKYPKVLSIAGSDSSGGAGIQADLKTITALKCYGATVITALTAQNTQGVQGIFPVTKDFIGEELDSVFSDIVFDAVKIGMLHDSNVIDIVRDKLIEYKAKNIVLDPVMVATSGDKLLRDDAIEILKTKLIPIVDLITPNVKEAEILSNMRISDKNDIEEAINKIRVLGVKNILIKGGDLDSENADDCLYQSENNDITWFHAERINTINSHGTGCTLSSAIASFLASGQKLNDAISNAKSYLTDSLKSAKDLKLGKGRGPIDHLIRL